MLGKIEIAPDLSTARTLLHTRMPMGSVIKSSPPSRHPPSDEPHDPRLQRGDTLVVE
jgi:hypothetical protein